MENMLKEDDYGIEKTVEALKRLSSLAALKLKKPVLGIEETVLREKFKCPISGEIMRDPVVLALGETYDRPHIQKRLDEDNLTCPQSKQVLSHSIPIPNRLVQELISDCSKKSGIALPKPYHDIDGEMITELGRTYMNSLLEKLSPSLSDQKVAAKELRKLTMTAPGYQAVFCEFPNAISRLLSPLSESKVEEDPDLQESLITTVRNLSIHDNNKRLIAETPRVILLLVESAKFGTIETRSNAAAALFSLATLKSNKVMIGNSRAPKALLDLLRQGQHPLAMKHAAWAIFSLCLAPENIPKFIEIKTVRVVKLKIRNGILIDELLLVLALLSENPNAVDELAELDTMCCLLQIIIDRSSERTKEKCVTVLHNMCSRDRTLLMMLGPEENEKHSDIIEELRKAFPTAPTA